MPTNFEFNKYDWATRYAQRIGCINFGGITPVGQPTVCCQIRSRWVATLPGEEVQCQPKKTLKTEEEVYFLYICNENGTWERIAMGNDPEEMKKWMEGNFCNYEWIDPQGKPRTLSPPCCYTIINADDMDDYPQIRDGYECTCASAVRPKSKP